MFLNRPIAADHKDLIHDVSFDFHGRRMATCSSDQSVEIWDRSESGEWQCTACIKKAHSGSVWKVAWAHPEFGQVIATCSFDRTVAIYEELVSESTTGNMRSQTHWIRRASLVDSKTSVTDVKFAPKHLGLLLATCSSDGVVIIYEAPDLMNLSQWPLQHSFTCKIQLSCLSWNTSRLHPPMIAVGSDDPNHQTSKVMIHEYQENSRKWSRVEAITQVTDAVNDVSFAPNLGRSYHTLAVAGKDVRIYQLKPMRKDNIQTSSTRYEIKQIAQVSENCSQVWRLSWNITGTVVASSGNDGYVRLWKSNYMDNWKCIYGIRGDGMVEDKESLSHRQQINQPYLATMAHGPSGLGQGSSVGIRYYKGGNITSPSQVPWH